MLSGLQLRSISFNTLFQFSVRIITSLGTLIATLLIAYFLGYDTVGSFTKVTAFVASFYLLVDFGLNSVFLKLYFKDTEKNLGNLITIRLIASLLLVPIVIFGASLLPHNEALNTGFSDFEKVSIGIYSLTIISFALYNSLQVFLQKKLAYRLLIFPSFVSLLILLALVYLAVTTTNFYLLFGAYIFSGSITNIVIYFLIKRQFRLAISTQNIFSFSKTLLSRAWPLGLILFFNFIYSRTDIFILSYFKQNTDVGIYGISYRFFDVAVAIPTYLANSTYPVLLSVMENPFLYRKTFKKYLWFYLFISLLILPFAILLSPIISLLKNEFYYSVAPLQILSLSLPFFFLTSLLQWHFIIKSKMKFLVLLYGGALLLNVFLNVVFIPLYSYYAAAVVTGVCEALVFIIMLSYFLRTRNN